MKSQIFNQNSKNQIILSNQFYQSKRITKYRSIFDARTNNTIVLLEIERATVYESKEFYDYIMELVNDNKTNIIIDMEKVYFMDSVFFGTLIKLLKTIDKKLGYMKLIVDYKSKPEMLSISNFEGIFEIYPNLFEAVDHNKAS
jgi:anti-anti-sigma factor